MCMNTFPNVLERLKLLRFTGTDISFNQIAMYHGVTQGNNSEIMLYFRKERRHETGNFRKGLFLEHFQPPLDKNSEDLAILILEFDDVTVKTIYCFLSSLDWGPQGGPVWGPRFVPSLLKTLH